jgi:hypothetical protein
MRLLALVLIVGFLTACGSAQIQTTPIVGQESTSVATAMPANTVIGARSTASAVTSTPVATPVPTSTVHTTTSTASTMASATPSPPTATPALPANDVGFLEGQVTIGPLSPVERVGVPTPTPSPAVCTSWGLAIYDPSGQTLVTSLRFQPDCSYRVALKPGSYSVHQSQQQAVGGSKNLPAAVTIESGKTVRLDISIDTGIR